MSMSRSDQTYPGRSRGTTATLHREGTLPSFADYSSGDGPWLLVVLGNSLLYRQFFCLGSLLCCLTSLIGYPVAYVLLPSLTGVFSPDVLYDISNLVPTASFLMRVDVV